MLLDRCAMIAFFNQLKRKIFFLGYKRMEIPTQGMEILEIPKEHVSSFALSFNTIKVVSFDGQEYFFRECRQHSEFVQFIKKLLEEFYELAEKGTSTVNFAQEIPIRTVFSKAEIEKFRTYMNLCMERKDFFKKIRKMDYYLKKENFSIWNGNLHLSKKSLQSIGLSFFKEKNELLTYFFAFLNSALISYQFHSFVKLNSYETYFASRQMASFEFAKLIGLRRLIPNAELVGIDVGGGMMYGVLNARAEGVRGLDSKSDVTPLLQRDFSNLRLLDVLCYQNDHFANNYNIVVDENGKAVSVCAFDNDSNKTFAPLPRLNFAANRCCAPFLTRSGLINLPHLDKKTALKLFNLNKRMIDERMGNYLNRIQLWFLFFRVKKICSSIKKTIETKPDFLIDSSEWSEETIKEELFGGFGNTYLVQYLNKEKLNS